MRTLPLPLIVAGLLLVLLGTLVSPELLKALGPMRRALESSDDLVRGVAELEVLAFRGVAVVLGCAALVLVPFWQRVQQSHWVSTILTHEADAPPAFDLWNVASAPFIVLALSLASFLTLMAVGPRLFGQDTLSSWSAEDGPIEQLTAYLFVFASVVAFTAAHYERSRCRKLWLVLFGVGFLVCSAEEISWGQRIFGFDTPESMSALNVQDESNLHNLFGYAADHLFIASLFLYGAALPMVVNKFPFVHKLCDRIGLPIALPGLAVGFLLISLFQSWTIHRVIPQSGLRPEEVRELLSALGLVLLMWEAYRRSRSPVGQLATPGNAADPRQTAR